MERRASLFRLPNPSFPPQAIASDAGLLADLIQTLRHTEEKKTE